MAINFPSSLDSLTNPTTSSPLNSPSHAGQHSDANDAIEALQAKVGADSSAVTSSHDYKIAQLESGKVDKSSYDAHSILYATTDNTPAALTVGEQTVVGRATGGNISALSIDSDLSSVSANDDTIPSAKATKAALDAKAPLASPTFTGTVTLPKTVEIQDTSADHQYVLAVNELTADRTVTLPLLGGNDEFTFNAHTQTLTNKRITLRVSSETSSATPTINTDNCDIHRITALATDITSMTTNLSGTPTHGQKLIIEITGTAARAITWGASFEASTVALPTTTVTTAMLSVGFSYNSATSKWRCLASA